MRLVEFIHKYCSNSYRGFVEDVFEMKEGLEKGIPIPEGFNLLTDICRYPYFAIFVNEEERAILRCDEKEYSLSIYDSLVVWKEVIKEHRKYYKDAYFIRWFTLISIDAVENMDLFYPGGNYLGGNKGFYNPDQYENVKSAYEYSYEEIKEICPSLKITKIPWFLIVEEEADISTEELYKQIQNPLLSSGDTDEVNSFLLAHRKRE